MSDDLEITSIADVEDSYCCGMVNQKNRKAHTREEYLNTLFVRDSERLWPVPRVFLPIWKEAGELHAVIRVNEDQIPDTPYADGEQPAGEVIEPFCVHRGSFHPVEENFYEHRQQMAKYDAQQRRRTARALRHAIRQ